MAIGANDIQDSLVGRQLEVGRGNTTWLDETTLGKERPPVAKSFLPIQASNFNTEEALRYVKQHGQWKAREARAAAMKTPGSIAAGAGAAVAWIGATDTPYDAKNTLGIAMAAAAVKAVRAFFAGQESRARIKAEIAAVKAFEAQDKVNVEAAAEALAQRAEAAAAEGRGIGKAGSKQHPRTSIFG
jgi:hypothetical protein